MTNKILFWNKFGAIILIIVSIVLGSILNSEPASASSGDEIVLYLTFDKPIITDVYIFDNTYKLSTSECNFFTKERIYQ